MLPATVIRRLEALGEPSQQGKRLNGLFRLLETPILWYEAYANIYSNDGALTPGVDNVTLDGFSEQRVSEIITQLKDGSYRFRPVRRVYIAKANGKKRPLGVPSGNDKLVQEVVRNILERIYEPVFENCSHGFRPERSPHTALKYIEREWTATKWIIDMDIQSYFDNINHDLLMVLLEKKIEDKRFLNLIKAMLKAGYLEDWKFHTTYSGAPQGSILSPILANIYLHELDLFMETLKECFDKGKRRKANKPYSCYSDKISRLREKIDALKKKGGEQERILAVEQDIRQVEEKRRKIPSGDPFDKGYKRLHFCRYADDFMIGIIGSREDAETVSQEVRNYIQEKLKLTISEEKFHIRHSTEGATFVGYHVKTYSGNRVVKVKRGNRHTTFKSTSERLQFHIPQEKLQRFCINKRYGDYTSAKAKHRPELLSMSDAEIVLIYNAELRGLANYYTLAQAAKRDMNKLARICWVSLLKTLAAKHKSTVTKIANQLKAEDGYALIIKEEKKTRLFRIFRLKDLKPPPISSANIDVQPNIFQWTLSRSELIRRLNAEKCEYCDTKEGPFEVHHIRKMKDVALGKELWQRVMAARNRKTLILCCLCHDRLHAGNLPDTEHAKRQVKGEPTTPKGVRSVLRGGDG